MIQTVQMVLHHYTAQLPLSDLQYMNFVCQMILIMIAWSAHAQLKVEVHACATFHFNFATAG